MPPKDAPRSALKAGRVTAVVEGLEYALTTEIDDPLVQIGMFLGPTESLAFAVRKQDQHLRSALNEYVANLRRTPTWNRLVVKYFGEQALEMLNRVRQP